MDKSPDKGHWHEHSLQWDKLGSPLRPNAEDLSSYRKHLAGKRSPLILGVTPELASLNGNLVCADLCADRINLLWNSNSENNAVQANWLHLPFKNRQFDAVLGDGVFTQLVYPTQYVELLNSIIFQLKPGGHFISRIFINTEPCQTAEEVCAIAANGLIGSFHAFKWRFTMALLNEKKERNERDHCNIPVVDIVNSFNQYFPDRETLSKNAGWSIDSISTIDVYNNSPAIYSFPTLSQLNDVLPDSVTEEVIEHGTYELAEYCPIIVWKVFHE